MFKTLIAGVAALSLTITPLQAQEFNEDDFGKFLFGLVAAGIVAKALSDRRDDTVQTYQPSRSHALNPNHYEPPVVRHRENRNPPRLNPGGGRDRGGLQPRGNGHRQNAHALPRRCYKTVETRFGTQTMLARNCLNQHYRFAARLPQKCAVRVLTRNAAHNGFDPLCLRREGYTTAHRR